MITCAQNLHDLHGQRHDDELPGLSLRNRDVEIQLAASDHHVLHNMINRVMVDARPTGNDVANIAAVMPEELSRVRKCEVAPLGGEHAI